MTPRKFETYAAANEAKQDGQTVAGVYDAENKPVYFLVSADATSESMRRLAFQVRNGRPLSGYENTMLELAESGVVK